MLMLFFEQLKTNKQIRKKKFNVIENTFDFNFNARLFFTEFFIMFFEFVVY